ncbi:MAG: MGMT family protein [bacterium]|nr:MGMT family protein [bacterium]
MPELKIKIAPSIGKNVLVKQEDFSPKKYKDKKYSQFYRKVWDVTRNIPLGETRTYKWVSKKIGKPMASRAVGNALNKNPYLIEVPCHRVVKSTGEVGGLAKGIEFKIKLLEAEGVKIKKVNGRYYV